MKRWVSRSRIHLCVWTALGAYLAITGTVRARLGGSIGRATPIMLGSAHARSAVSITFQEPTVTKIDGQDVYLLSGYAPPGGSELPEDRQDTAIVLLGDRGAALRFETQSVILPSIIRSLRAKDREVVTSSISAYISRDALPAGAYRLAVMFTASSVDTLLLTDRFLVRTPNTLHLYGYRPSAREPLEELILRHRLSVGSIPEVRMAYDFWQLARLGTDAEGMYSLLGYAFPFASNMPVDRYHKRIVLVGDDLTPHLFEAATIIRPDVGRYYASLGMEVDASGFAVRINKDALGPGRYQLAILYTAEGVQPAYWPSDRYIQFDGDIVTLLPRVNPNP